MSLDLRDKGFDEVQCSRCKERKWRKSHGSSPNGKRTYYQDENGKAWRGKKCPSCAKFMHSLYIKNARAKRRALAAQV